MRDSTEKSATGSVSYTDTLGYIDAGLSFDVMINFIARPDFSFGIFGGVEGITTIWLLMIKKTQSQTRLKVF